MSEKAKKVLKTVGKDLLLAAVTILITGTLIYLLRGWPVAAGLRDRAERGEVASIEITQNGDTVTLTKPDDLTLAAGVTGTLTVAFPGSATQEQPETEYLFTFTDGTQTRVGASQSAVFRDGKTYRPAGEKDCTLLFYNMTEGLFFPGRAVE
mgnify:CR=1 FL=1